MPLPHKVPLIDDLDKEHARDQEAFGIAAENDERELFLSFALSRRRKITVRMAPHRAYDLWRHLQSILPADSGGSALRFEKVEQQSYGQYFDDPPEQG